MQTFGSSASTLGADGCSRASARGWLPSSVTACGAPLPDSCLSGGCDVSPVDCSSCGFGRSLCSRLTFVAPDLTGFVLRVGFAPRSRGTGLVTSALTASGVRLVPLVSRVPLGERVGRWVPVGADPTLEIDVAAPSGVSMRVESTFVGCLVVPSGVTGQSSDTPTLGSRRPAREVVSWVRQPGLLRCSVLPRVIPSGLIRSGSELRRTSLDSGITGSHPLRGA